MWSGDVAIHSVARRTRFADESAMEQSGAATLRWFRSIACWTAVFVMFREVQGNMNDMMKDLGAVEVTDEMIQKSLAEGRKEQAEKARVDAALHAQQEARKAQQTNVLKDPVNELRGLGVDVSDGSAERMRDAPDRVKEAMDESVAAATQLAMYQQARCEGCQAFAEVFASSIMAAWQPKWSQNSVLEYAQAYCDSDALSGPYQIIAVGNDTHMEYVVDKFSGEDATTPHSLETFRRICREAVYEHDEDISGIAISLKKEKAKLDKYEKVLNSTLCASPCRAKKGKKSKRRKKSEL